MKRLIILSIMALMLLSTGAFAVVAAPTATFGDYGIATVYAWSGGQQATYSVPFTEVLFSGEYTWSLPGRTALRSDDGTLLGYLNGLTITAGSDPYLGIDFIAQAGSSDTQFMIVSEIAFQSITDATAYATAQIGCTDRNQNGAQITGTVNDAGNAYFGSALTAQGADTGTTFLIDTPIVANVRGSMTGSGNSGMGEASNVGKIYCGYSFILTAGDAASGTSFAQVEPNPVPEPSSILLLGMGLAGTGVFFTRKRQA